MRRVGLAGRVLRAFIILCCAAVALPVLADSATIVAPGRVESAAPPLAIGVAAAGTIDQILVHAGSRVRTGDILFKLNCGPLEADMRVRAAQAQAAQSNFDRVQHGPRPQEIEVGEAVVRYSQARADEALKTQTRTEALQEGVTVTSARILEVQRDARIAAAQLEEARARLSLLRAGSRDEDIQQARALRDASAAAVEATRVRLEQCTVHAPVDGVVADIAANPGEYVSLAVPQPILHLLADGPPRVQAEIELRDAARVCLQQHATVTAATSGNGAIPAQVAFISPAIAARSMSAAATDSHDTDILPVVLTLSGGGTTLPIGMPVTVRFEACPPKS